MIGSLNLDNFDWGWMNGSELGLRHKKYITEETFEYRLYEKFFEVEADDIVLDIGASVGTFTYSILNKKPKHVFCLEPSELEFPTLIRNTLGYPVTHILKGISPTEGLVNSEYVYGDSTQMEGITFKKLISLYGLEKIDFLKIDCEGGEYDVFTEENFDYIRNNVRKIVGEWHLSNPDLKEKFRIFRNEFLSKFSQVEVYATDNINIKWDLWNEHFINYYTEVIIYIDNRHD